MPFASYLQPAWLVRLLNPLGRLPVSLLDSVYAFGFLQRFLGHRLRWSCWMCLGQHFLHVSRIHHRRIVLGNRLSGVYRRCMLILSSSAIFLLWQGLLLQVWLSS